MHVVYCRNIHSTYIMTSVREEYYFRNFQNDIQRTESPRSVSSRAQFGKKVNTIEETRNFVHSPNICICELSVHLGPSH
jgi:hypothetical protein